MLMLVVTESIVLSSVPLGTATIPAFLLFPYLSVNSLLNQLGYFCLLGCDAPHGVVVPFL